MLKHTIFLFAYLLSLSSALIPNAARLARGGASSGVTPVRMSTPNGGASPSDKPYFKSKFVPDLTEQELSVMFKEFNITNFDLNKDPEILKWAPSKEFFEQYGFQNNTERYKRKTMDVKIDFYGSYRQPILPQYKTFIADIMVMYSVQTIDSRFKYDAIFAFGVCTQYYTIMKGYALQDEVPSIILIKLFLSI